LTNCALASIAYGFHKCSAKWKIAPQQTYRKQWQPARDCRSAGGKVRKAIGFDATPRELKRTHRCSTYAVQEEEAELFDLWFPLPEWGLGLGRVHSSNRQGRFAHTFQIVVLFLYGDETR